eukprot:GHVO01005605.1.p2 GENE.GHVO01005605.1~~GHVO01005605.1.p2  ORF type:complete len:297 (+),score=68.51 GHVO01005605.1:1037-1927(+)
MKMRRRPPRDSEGTSRLTFQMALHKTSIKDWAIIYCLVIIIMSESNHCITILNMTRANVLPDDTVFCNNGTHTYNKRGGVSFRPSVLFFAVCLIWEIEAVVRGGFPARLEDPDTTPLSGNPGERTVPGTMDLHDDTGVEENDDMGLEENDDMGVEENDDMGLEENDDMGEEENDKGVEENGDMGVEENGMIGYDEREKQNEGEDDDTPLTFWGRVGRRLQFWHQYSFGGVPGARYGVTSQQGVTRPGAQLRGRRPLPPVTGSPEALQGGGGNSVSYFYPEYSSNTRYPYWAGPGNF